MTPIEIIKLIVWVAILAWGVLWANSQLDRLNNKIFKKTQLLIIENLNKSSGFYRLAGIILYSPYIYPIKSMCIWVFIIFILITF
jgi:hypothetical protein